MESINAAEHLPLPPQAVGPQGAASTWWAARVERHRLPRERERLLARPRGQERRPRARPRAPAGAQGDLVREASLRAQLAALRVAAARRPRARESRAARAPGRLARGHRPVRRHPRLHAAHRVARRAPMVIGLLDDYFTEMIDVIFRHQGTVEQLDRRRDRRAVRGARGRARRAGCAPCGAALDMVAAVRRCRALGAPRACRRSTSASGSAPGRVMAGHDRLGPAPRADRGRARDDRRRAHPAHDTALRRAYHRERGDVPAGGSISSSYRELGTAAAQGHQAAADALRDPRPTGSRPARSEPAVTPVAGEEPVDETTILIVDDEPRVLDALEAILAAEFRVLRAGTARRRSAARAEPTSRSSSPTTGCPA